MNGTHPNGNITYNAAAAIAKGQPVKFTGSTTTPSNLLSPEPHQPVGITPA